MTALTIKAIYVDPFAMTVEQIEMPNDFDEMKAEYLKCNTAQPVDLGMGATAWIDEEGTFKDWSAQGWTCFAGVVTLAGRIVIVGTDADGEMMDSPKEVTTEVVRGAIEFIPYKKVRLPAPSLTTFDDNGKPHTEQLGRHQWRTHKTG